MDWEKELETRKRLTDTLKAELSYQEAAQFTHSARRQTEIELTKALEAQAEAAWNAGEKADFWATKAEIAALALDKLKPGEVAGVWAAYQRALEATGAGPQEIERARRQQMGWLGGAAREALGAGDIQAYYGAVTQAGGLQREGPMGALGYVGGQGRIPVLSPEQFAQFAVQNNITVEPVINVFVELPDGTWRQAAGRAESGRQRADYYAAHA